MARDKAMFSKSVTDSDAFVFDLSHDAQALYFHSQGEADNDGFIKSARGLAARYGFDATVFEELVAAGYLVPLDGGYLIDHWWVHNNIDRIHYRESEHTPAVREAYFDACEDLKGLIGIARAYESGKSLRGDSFQTPKLIEANRSESNQREGKEREGKGKGAGKGEPGETRCQADIGKPRPSLSCPNCGEPCLTGNDPLGNTILDCPNCGTFTVDENGEILEAGDG